MEVTEAQNPLLVENTRDSLLEKLQEIWDEVGESNEERDKILLQLEQERLEVYKGKVEHASKSKAQLLQALSDAKLELSTLLSALGENSFAGIPKNTSVTIKEELAAIALVIQQLKKQKEERIKDFSYVQSQIQKIHGEITGNLNFNDVHAVDESDLSLKRFEEHQSELQELQKEKNDRLQKVLEHVIIVHGLCVFLGMDFSSTVTEVHPSLNDFASVHSKSISNYTLAKLANLVLKLKEDKKQAEVEVKGKMKEISFEKQVELKNQFTKMQTDLATPAYPLPGVIYIDIGDGGKPAQESFDIPNKGQQQPDDPSSQLTRKFFGETSHARNHEKNPVSPTTVQDEDTIGPTSSVIKNVVRRRHNGSRLMDSFDEPDRRSDWIKNAEEDHENDLEEDVLDKNTHTQFNRWNFFDGLHVILVIVALVTTLSIASLKDMNVGQLKLWKWEVMLLILIVGRMISNWLIRIVVFCIERKFLFKKKVLYYVYGVRSDMGNCVWFGLTLIAWCVLFNKRAQRETRSDFLRYITKVLVCILLSTLVWLLKSLAVVKLKRLMRMVRRGALTTLDELILHSNSDDEHPTQIRSENEAKAAAKKIFENVVRRGCSFIHHEDLKRFMREDQALKIINLFEGASDTGISKSALKNWMLNAFRERRALALSLLDRKTILNELRRMLNIFAVITIVIIWVLKLKIFTPKFLLYVGSQLVLVAFVFGNTLKTLFEAIIFLFVMHPFDVGDRCEIDGIEMIVEKMNLLNTVFLRNDKVKITIPNSVLATKNIYNFYRSPDTEDYIEFYIHIATPPEKIAMMKHRINSYIDRKKEHWYPSPCIVLKDLEQMDMVRFAMWPTHRMNFQDMEERHIRRSLMIEELLKIFKDLDIKCQIEKKD